jgi:nitroreductase
MEFNLEQIDTLLSTTRAVRRRLDFTREVPDEVLLRCIDLAEQAPSGGNVTSRRWLVMRDPDTKARLAALYRDAGGRGLIETAERLRGSAQARERVVTSAAYLAQHLERVPVLVLVTIWGTHDGSGRPGLFDSSSGCLEFASLASAGTGRLDHLHLGRAREVAPSASPMASQVVLLPVAYTHGTDFHQRRGDPPRPSPGSTAGAIPTRILATAAPCWPPVRGSPWKSTSPPHRRGSGSW